MKEVLGAVVIVGLIYYAMHRFSAWMYKYQAERARREAEFERDEREPWGV